MPEHRHTFNPYNINTNEKHSPYSTECDASAKTGNFNKCKSYIPINESALYNGTTEEIASAVLVKANHITTCPPIMVYII